MTDTPPLTPQEVRHLMNTLKAAWTTLKDIYAPILTPATREATDPATGPVVPPSATPLPRVATPFADSIRRDQAAERARLEAEFDRGFDAAIEECERRGRFRAVQDLRQALGRIRGGRPASGSAVAPRVDELGGLEPLVVPTDEAPEKSGPQNQAEARDIATELGRNRCVDCTHFWGNHALTGGCMALECRCTEPRPEGMTLADAITGIEAEERDRAAHPTAHRRYQLRDRVWVGGSRTRMGVAPLPGVITGVTFTVDSPSDDTRYRVNVEIGDLVQQWSEINPADLAPRTDYELTAREQAASTGPATWKIGDLAILDAESVGRTAVRVTAVGAWGQLVNVESVQNPAARGWRNLTTHRLTRVTLTTT